MWNNEILLDQKKISRIFGKKYTIILVALLNMFLEKGVMAKVIGLPESNVAVFQKYKNFVVLDAGSRGTRVSVFRIYLNMATEFNFDCEFYNKVDVGLSSSISLDDRIKSIKYLVDFAKSVINEEEWQQTPIALRATAGLRDLPKDQSDIILAECQNVLKRSLFETFEDSATILSGFGEALDFWLSINLMLKRLRPGNTKNTVAVLDLGGGSTQLAGHIHKENEAQFYENVKNLKIFDSNMNIYADSYSALGLTKARKNILITEAATQYNDQINKVRWECMNPHIYEAFQYEGEKYSITKSSNDSKNARFALCLEVVHKYLSENSYVSPPLKDYEIYASSGFAYTADKAGLLNTFGEGKVTVKSYYDAGKQMCEDEKVDQNNPFNCFESTYVYSLLYKSFNLNQDTSINIVNNIGCHEVNWSLGFAFSKITNLDIR